MNVIILSVFFFILSLQPFYSQETQGSVIYKMEVLPQKHFEDLKDTQPNRYQQYITTANRFKNQVEQLNFILAFQGVESSYQAEEFLNKTYEVASSFGAAKGMFYNNQQTGERLQKVERNGRNFVISRDELAWEITLEVKQIGEFKTRKAITFTNVFDPRENKNIKQKAVAWFAPDIPIQFGPEGYGGLPGLILELQVAGGRYYLDELNFNKNNISIDKISSENSVTFAEFQTIMRDLTRNFRTFHGTH